MPVDAGSDTLKTIVKGAGIAFIGIIASKLFTYLFRVLVARYFGPGDYGLFSLGIGVLSIFAIFAILGLNTGIIRYTAHYRAKGNDGKVRGVIKSSIKMALPFSVLMSAIMVALSPYMAVSIFREPGLADILVILAFSIPFSTMISILSSVFLGFKKNKYQVLSEEISTSVLKLALVIAFGVLGFSVVGIAWAWTISAVIVVFISIYFLKKIYPGIRARASVSVNRELLSYSLPLLLGFSVSYLIIWTDTIMLGFMKTATDVGIYSAAMPTSQLLFIFPNALAALFLPIITGLYARRKSRELSKVYKTVTRWAFYMNFPLFLLLTLFSSQILSIIFGPEYASGSWALILISTGFLFRKSALALQILQMLKKTRHIFLIEAVCASMNVALNLLFIPYYGITGAALASMISYISYIFLLLVLSYRFGRMNPFSRSMLKSVLAGLAAVSVIYLATTMFSAASVYAIAGLCVIFVLIYGFILLLLKGFDRDDIEIMKAIERKSGLRLNFLRRIFERFA